MPCSICKSDNVELLKEGRFLTGYFCNDCGNGTIDYNYKSCCNNQNFINVQFEQSNLTIVQRVICKNCYSFNGGAIKKDKSFADYPKYTQQKFKEIESEKTYSRDKLMEYINLLRNEFKLDQNSKFWKNYSIYLQSDKWKCLRQQVLLRENDLCQGCKQNKAIHVHHTTYDNLYNELLFQLIALCVQCHQKIHPDKQPS